MDTSNLKSTPKVVVFSH